MNMIMTASTADLMVEIATIQAQLEGWNQVSRAINSARNESELLEAFAGPALERDATAAFLFYIDVNEAGHPQWAKMVAALKKGPPELPIIPTPCAHLPKFPFVEPVLVDPDEPQLIEDIVEAEGVHWQIRDMYVEAGVEAVVVIPLLWAEEWVGFIGFNWVRPHQFSRQEKQIYRALLTLAPPAIARRRTQLALESLQ